MNYSFTSDRLGFRTWTEADTAPFIEMNKDPEVMEHFPKTLSEEETMSLISRIDGMFDEHGYGPYAVEVLESKEFIGFIGFLNQRFETEFTPCHEIGWRLRRSAWNKGYATEGANRCLAHAFDMLGFDEVQSWTPTTNVKSERVMQKIGMKKVGEFDHPLLEIGTPLTGHVRYLISKDDFQKK